MCSPRQQHVSQATLSRWHASMLAVVSLFVTSMSSVAITSLAVATTTTTEAAAAAVAAEVGIGVVGSANISAPAGATESSSGGGGGGNCSKTGDNEQIGSQIARYGIVPAAFLGILTNIVAFWIWHAETEHKVMTLLFKYLSLCDILYLAFNIAFIYLLEEPCRSWYHGFVTHTRNFTQLLSVHTTLMVAACRCVAVCVPLKAETVLTRRSVVWACVAVAAWCLAIETVEIFRKKALPRPYQGTARDRSLLASHETFGYILPWTLLLLVSLHIVRTTRRQFNQASCLVTQLRDAANEDHHRHRDYQRRLTLTVLCVALSSFVAYPIGVIVELVSTFTLYKTCEGYVYYDTLATLGGLLQVINSGINLFFYLAFITRFRELLDYRLPDCLRVTGSV